MNIRFKKTSLRQNLQRLRTCFYRPSVEVKETYMPPKTTEPSNKNAIKFNQPRLVLHGVIMERNDLGGINYSLDPSKTIPLVYNFVMQKPKQRSPRIHNLTNELQRVCYNGFEFETLFSEQPHLNRTVGALPQKWGRQIGNSPEKDNKLIIFLQNSEENSIQK